MPQWIHILDYDAEERDRSHFFYSIFVIWNWFTNHFLLCGSGGLGFLQLGITLYYIAGFLAWKWKNLTATRLALVSPIHIHIEG